MSTDAFDMVKKYKKDWCVRMKISLILLTIFLMFPSHAYAAADSLELTRMYKDYQVRFKQIEEKTDIDIEGFQIIEEQVFSVTLQCFGEVSFIPALEKRYGRLAIFLAKEDGSIVYKTDQLETNYGIRGELKQPNKGISAVSFKDINKDGLTDIILITTCENETGSYAGKTYKVGDVLFQNARGFYRDYRISDKINRYGMNKSIEFITSFINEGYSTEFLYTSSTLDDLKKQGMQIVSEQCYWRTFEKLGKLLVVPGIYKMAEYSVVMVYLVNEQGYIVWSFQPMGDYESLYALKGIACRDIDGDGLKDIVVLARYSYEGDAGKSMIESDYAIYYQRTGGFTADTEYKKRYRCSDGDTMEKLVKKARAYWGWK